MMDIGITEPRNKKSLGKFEPETERINGSYRYEVPTYHYKKPDRFN